MQILSLIFILPLFVFITSQVFIYVKTVDDSMQPPCAVRTYVHMLALSVAGYARTKYSMEQELVCLRQEEFPNLNPANPSHYWFLLKRIYRSFHENNGKVKQAGFIASGSKLLAVPYFLHCSDVDGRWHVIPAGSEHPQLAVLPSIWRP